MNKINTKGVMTIQKLDSKLVPFDISFELFETDNPGYFGEGEIECISSDTLPAPDKAYSLKVGEVIKVYVEMDIIYTEDYWGEGDSEIEYISQQVIKNQIGEDNMNFIKNNINNEEMVRYDSLGMLEGAAPIESSRHWTSEKYIQEAQSRLINHLMGELSKYSQEKVQKIDHEQKVLSNLTLDLWAK